MVVDMGFANVSNLRKLAGELRAPIDPLNIASYMGIEVYETQFTEKDGKNVAGGQGACPLRGLGQSPKVLPADLGVVWAVLCVISIYLLSKLLKFNRIDASQDSGESDNIAFPFSPNN
jgi:hypothetical protein